MSRLYCGLLLALLVFPVSVFAQLPPLNEEEAAKKAEAAEKKAASEEAAKAALAQAQDRVAKRYYLKHPGAARPVPVAAAKPTVPAAPATK